MAEQKKKKQKTNEKSPAKKAVKKTSSAKKRKTARAGKRSFSGKHAVIIGAALVLVLALALGIRYIFKFEKETDPAPEEITGFSDPIDIDDPELDEEVQVDMLNELRSSGDLYTLLHDWASNDTGHSLMQSKDVINFLIVGLDASNKNSDVIMVASVHKGEKKLLLNSIMRDSYTYIKTPERETAAKINAAYANGGISCLINTVENDYKIKIDHYISVNFNTFVELVDIVGGVSVPVQQYEMREMNRIAESGDERLNEYGDSVLLNGKQALLYCRIRKCDWDGDVSRTRRQRAFLAALVEKSRGVSITEVPELVKTLHKYVKTDCDVSTLVSFATQAVTGKWYNYEQISGVFPQEENRMDYSGKAWVWIVDYPADAVALQTLIYGETNIRLSEDRRTAMDVVRSGGF